MIQSLRKKFNAQFSDEKYQSLYNLMTAQTGHTPKFRVAETPVFVETTLRNQLLEACTAIFEVIKRKDFKEKTQGAFFSEKDFVPNEDEHTHFMQVDFGICEDEKGNIVPQLIEIQGFPSLYAFQVALANAYKAVFDIPSNFTNFFNGLGEKTYLDLLKEVIVGKHKPQNVVLLEIEPHRQATNIDFYVTEKYLGVRPICVTEVIKKGQKLFYKKENGRLIRIKRIYNRVIFDELEKRPDLQMQFQFNENVEVEWAGHPNWFYRISKYTLPLLKNKYVPDCNFLSDVKEIPTDLENYVLKPLFSFAGMGVKINVTKADIDAIPLEQRKDFLLQRKVNYAPIIETPDEKAKFEIRVMVLWADGWENPKIVNNICRVSKGEMVGVRYNKDKTWVGGSVCFFEG